MFEIHNGELTQDVILGAVAAWLEQKNDTMMTIEVGFQRDTSRRTNFDLIAETKVTILKPEDFRPPNKLHKSWKDEDPRMNLEKKTSERDKEAFDMIREAFEGWKNKSAEDDSGEKKGTMSPSCEGIWSDEVEMYKARLWELPSAEYYPVKFIEGISRKLNRRTSTSELDTAQEAPAVREKGEANDRTDQDCRTLPTDLASSKESLAAEAPTQVEKSPPLKEEEKAVSPVKPIPEKIEEKVPEKKEEPVKVVEVKKEEIVTRPKRSKRRRQLNMKRRPDSGELKILAEKNGIVTFTCSTKHRVKKSKSKKDGE